MFPTKIPKLIHLFWDTNTSMSFLRLQTLVSLRKLNPDFKIILHISKDETAEPVWKTHEFRDVKYMGEDFYSEAKNYVDRIHEWGSFELGGMLPAVYKADLIRLIVLIRWGGAWSDMDIIWRKPLDRIFVGHFYNCDREDELDFATIFHDGSTGGIVATENCEYLKSVFEYAKADIAERDYQSAGPLAFRKCGIAEDVHRRFPDLRFMDIDYEILTPIAWDRPDLRFDACVDLPETCAAIHWFAGSREAARFMNAHSTRENLSGVDNTIIRELRRLELL